MKYVDLYKEDRSRSHFTSILHRILDVEEDAHADLLEGVMKGVEGCFLFVIHFGGTVLHCVVASLKMTEMGMDMDMETMVCHDDDHVTLTVTFTTNEDKHLADMYFDKNQQRMLAERQHTITIMMQ